jgi:hypothetical protein
MLLAAMAVQGQVVPGKNCSCVAFRLDDIQDSWITAAQMEIISTFKEFNIPLSVGIIANSFGTDATMVQFIKDNMDLYLTPRNDLNLR